VGPAPGAAAAAEGNRPRAARHRRSRTAACFARDVRRQANPGHDPERRRARDSDVTRFSGG
jgi:hypothetical protein